MRFDKTTLGPLITVRTKLGEVAHSLRRRINLRQALPKKKGIAFFAKECSPLLRSIETRRNAPYYARADLLFRHRGNDNSQLNLNQLLWHAIPVASRLSSFVFDRSYYRLASLTRLSYIAWYR